MKYIHIRIHIRRYKVLTVNKTISHTYTLYIIIFHVLLTKILLRKKIGNINQFWMNECGFWFFSNKILSNRPILNKHRITSFLPFYHTLRL